MYTQYFGLSETPFAISPNPRYLYMSEEHREALAHLLYGISSDGCMILLTGDIGTGKTTLCRCLLEKMPDRTEIAVILNPRLTARDLLKTICEEFGILPGTSIATIKTYIDALNQYLLRAHADDRTIALIIDEAQNLDIGVLEQLRLLTNLETNTKKLLRIILIGQPELRDLLERPELIQVNQRITSRYHLGPLQPTDVRKYIQHRLNVAGDNTSTLFTEKAIQHVIKLTGGIPRLINVLCDRALLGAYAVNTDHVNLAIIKQAGREILPQKKSLRSRQVKYAMIIAAFLACLAIPAILILPDWHKETESPESVDTQPVTTVTETVVPTEEINEKPLTEEEPQADTIQSLSPETPTAEPQTQPEDSTTPVVIPKKAANETLPPQLTEPVTETNIPEKNTIPETVQKPETVVEETPDKSSVPMPEKTVNTITVSAPLLVLEKAGPIPQKTVEELMKK